jgi:arylsulfatase A-like enzyme
LLDKTIGKGNYTVFLTADHGTANNPSFLVKNHMEAGAVNMSAARKLLNDSLQKIYGVTGLIEQYINYQFYLDESVLQKNRIDKQSVKEVITSILLKQEGISQVVDLSSVATAAIPDDLKKPLSNGYNQKLSGDLQVIFRPQWLETWQKGTTHGLWNPYDAHIPLLFFGWGIHPGQLNREVFMSDIAPTLAALLHIQAPNASVGKVVEEAIQ